MKIHNLNPTAVEVANRLTQSYAMYEYVITTIGMFGTLHAAPKNAYL